MNEDEPQSLQSRILEFKIESNISIRDRLPDALIECFDMTCHEGGNLDPALNRDNVFDFDDSLRLVISRSQWEGEHIFHVQAIPEGPAFSNRTMTTLAALSTWAKHSDPVHILGEVMERLHEIGLIDIIGGELSYIAEFDLGTLHIFMKHVNSNEDESSNE